MSTRRSVEPVLTTEFLVRQSLLLLCLLCVKASAAGASAFQVAKTNCTATCGDVTILFPFGIGTGCFLDEWYEMVCLQKESNTFVPRLKKIGLDVFNISQPRFGNGWVKVNFPISYSSSNCTNSVGAAGPGLPPSLSGSNFIFSQQGNKLIVVGCNDIALMNSTDSVIVGCKSECREGSNVSRFSDCTGSGCCQVAIPSNLQVFNIIFQTAGSATASRGGDGCSFAFLMERSWFNPGYTDLYSLRNGEYTPVLLGWGIGNDTSILRTLMTSSDYGKRFSCSNRNLDPSNYDTLPYWQCYCSDGFEGNGYLGDQGCQDINECEDPTVYPCPGKCVNTEGSHKCVDGSGALKLAMMVIGGFAGAILFLLLAIWLRKTINSSRKKTKLRQKYFKQNGGLLLQQQLASPEGNVEKSKLFNSKELERATDNFSQNRILGKGGQGTVYKGMLTDGRIVAIKKSTVPDEGKVEQFINEVFILSQINHRTVVKLLGYCLETEVPLLVYEFIPNGTLHQFLHDLNEEFPVPWDVRLRIASEVAGALFYLHSAASIPIYHRDIKTTNILLDEKYRAKVADFGTSRSVALNQTHVTTLVRGTVGYLDPEYFETNQFTDKSDVYSFGVVLVELLTGQKPISSLRAQEGIGLATYFILSMEDDRLFHILDARVLNYGNKEEIIAVAHLAKRCLNPNGRMRPAMKEVAMELEAIRRSSHPSDVQDIEKKVCGNFEIDEIEAQDFTFGSGGFEAGDGISSTKEFTCYCPATHGEQNKYLM